MDGLYDRTAARSSQSKVNFWRDDIQSNEAVPLRERRQSREEIDGKNRTTYSYQAKTRTVTQPALALNGQPYPTLPFSQGGYGLEENTNQIMMSRRLGKKMHHQHRPPPPRHRSHPSSPLHKRKPSMPHHSTRNWRENNGRRDNQRVPPQTPSVTTVRGFPKVVSSPRNDQIWDQRTFNAVMWQRNVAMDSRHVLPSLYIPPVNSWPQPSLSSFGFQAPLVPQFAYPLQNGYRETSRFHNPSVGLQIHHPTRFSWNEEQWLKNGMYNVTNMDPRAGQDGKMYDARLKGLRGRK